MGFESRNDGSLSSSGDITITSKTGNVSGDIIFQTGSAGTERLRIVSSDGSVKFPSGTAIVNVAGSSSSLNLQINSANMIQLFNTGHNCNRSWNMRSAMTSGSVTQDGTIYLMSNIDGAGYVTKWAIGLDIANSSQDDFTIARAVTSPTGVHDVIYIKAFDSVSATTRSAVGLNATPPSDVSVHVGSVATDKPILAINRRTGQTADGLVYWRSDKTTRLAGITAAGAFVTAANAAPADGDLVAGEAAIWFDSTNGAAKLMVKAKQADGTVKTGSVALA